MCIFFANYLSACIGMRKVQNTARHAILYQIFTNNKFGYQNKYTEIQGYYMESYFFLLYLYKLAQPIRNYLLKSVGIIKTNRLQLLLKDLLLELDKQCKIKLSLILIFIKFMDFIWILSDKTLKERIGIQSHKTK